MIEAENAGQTLICSECFLDEGLRIDAFKWGLEQGGACPTCQARNGRKLTKDHVLRLAWRFFVAGTTIRTEFGGAPIIQFNEQHYGRGNISPSPWLKNDIKIIEEAANIGFFHYGPRLWMVGEVEPLKELQDSTKCLQVIERILNEYPETTLAAGSTFYRLRINPERPSSPDEYDSPPIKMAGSGRLDSQNFPVMYGSQDIDICIHECRATVEDDIYVATLEVQRDMRLLDLTHVLKESVTEFESLDMAVHMLFLARSHSYEISRAISRAAKNAGFDGVIYPSFFSLIRTGGHPFETSYGLSLRRYHPEAETYARAYTIPNVGLFGRPLESLLVRVKCMNRLVLTQVGYSALFGPVTY